jgi:hypothetical protein
MTCLVLFMADPWISLDAANADPAVAAHCRLTNDRAAFGDADVVIYPAPTWGTKLPLARAHTTQVSVLWSQESAVHYPKLINAAYTAEFDLQMTYRLDSDVPIPYLGPDILAPARFHQPPDGAALTARCAAPISAWVSSHSDKCGRDRYLLELMQHVPVHSYGRVGHNCDLADDDGWDTKMATIGAYRFTIAFENSIATDYVTEKFFQPLVAGSVPIYRGAPNVADFAPTPDSYIDADRFDGPASLAHFLGAMTDADYLRYHEWRAHGPTEEWRRRFAPYSTHALVRLARAARVVAIGLAAAAAGHG